MVYTKPLIGLLAAVAACVLSATKAAALQPDNSFDVKHYDIRLLIDVPNQALSGTVTVKAVALARDLKTIRLDLVDEMTVESVKSEGAGLTFTHRDNLLDISLARAYKSGAPFEVTITYKGRPTGGPASGFHFSSRRPVPVVYSFGLHYNAPHWLPCKDGPGDKADSADIAVTLPRELVLVSNGNLVGETDNGDGTKTSRWAVRYPIYPDVISVAATNYATFTLPYTSRSGGHMDMTFYVYPEDLEKAKVDVSKTGEQRVLRLTVNQVQTDTGLFEMPLDVVVTTPSGKKTFVLWSKLKSQSFKLPVTEDVTEVALDPDGWVLKRIKL